MSPIVDNHIVDSERETQNTLVERIKSNLSKVKHIGRLDEDYNTNLRPDVLRKYIIDSGHSKRDADAAIKELEHAIAGCTGWMNLMDASADVYSLLRYGTDVKQQGAVSSRVHYIDWKTPNNNTFELAEEVKVETMGDAHDSRRPDLVLYVNGIALVVIELKKASVSVAEGMRQNYRNQQDGNIPRFFTTVQLAMAGNPSEGLWYGTTCTSEKFYLRWKEPTGSLADGVKQPGTFMNEPNELYRSVLQMIEPSRLLEFIHDMTIYDGGIKKVARPNQFFAFKAAQPRLMKGESGIIWHSQGSGKSLLMVWLTQWIIENIPTSRVVIITDRDELDKQITLGLRKTGIFSSKQSDEYYHAVSGNDLLTKLNDEEPNLITTLVNKFAPRGHRQEDLPAYKRGAKRDVTSVMQELAENLDRDFPNFKAKGKCFVFIDECHRTQGGIMHAAMRKIMGDDVMLVGFTGTPLLKRSEKRATSRSKFGSYIHTYLFEEAVKDGVVLDLKYEARDVKQFIADKNAIDALFEKSTRRLTSIAKEKIKERWATLQKLYSSRNRMERIAAGILGDMELKPALAGGWGNAMLVCDSIYESYQYWNIFNNTELKGKCAVVSSYKPSDPSLNEGFTGAKLTEEELKYKLAKEMMKGFPNADAFEEWAKKRFIKEPGQMKLLIVCDKLLTGFDAPAATYMYLDRKVVDHTLFQAICRVNRVNGKNKLFGYIIDYRKLFEFIEKAISDFSTVGEDGKPTDGDGFDTGDIKEILKNRLKELKKELEDALEAVEMQTEEVMQPKGLEEFFEYYCYPSSVVDYNEQGKYLEKNAQKRQYLYDAIGRLVRVYAELAADIDKVYSPAEVNKVFTRVHDYEETRRALMLRSGDSVDFKVYDAEMRSLIDRYVMAGEIDEIDDMDEFSFLDYISHAIEETEQKEHKRKGGRSNAETMINNTRRYVNRRRNSNPNEYMRLSARLERLIKDLEQQRIDYAEFLRKVKEINEELVGKGPVGDPILQNFAYRALYDNLGSDLDLTKKIIQVIADNISVGFRTVPGFQRRLKLAITNALKDTEYNPDVIYQIVDHHPEQWT